MWRWRISVLLLGLAVPCETAAQSWAYVTLNAWDPQIASSTLVEFPLTPTGLGAPQRQIFIPRTAGGPVVTADGRYVAFVVAATNDSPARAAYFDSLTGTLHFIAGLIPTGELFSDPFAVRLLLVADGTITIVEPGGVRSVTIAPIDTRVRPALSADGRELYAVRPRAETSVGDRIVVLDPLTGAEIRSLPELISTSPINLAVRTTSDCL